MADTKYSSRAYFNGKDTDSDRDATNAADPRCCNLLSERLAESVFLTMGTRTQTWCDFCRKEIQTVKISLITDPEARSTDKKTVFFDACDTCVKRLRDKFISEAIHKNEPLKNW